MNKMRNLIVIALLSFGAISTAAFAGSNFELVVSKADGNEKVSVVVEGMACAMGCANAIENTLNKTEGIVSASVNFEEGTADVEFDPEVISKEDILKTIESVNGGDHYKASFAVAGSDAGAKKSCCSSASGKSGCSSEAGKSGCASKGKKSCSGDDK
jgi:Cu+-exporting ATPase